jgi:hypothetical protein
MELWNVPNRRRSGSLGVPESSKIERGRGVDIRDALTRDGDGWRWLNFEAAIGEKTAVLQASVVMTLRVRKESGEEVQEEQDSGAPFIGGEERGGGT